MESYKKLDQKYIDLHLNYLSSEEQLYRENKAIEDIDMVSRKKYLRLEDYKN